MKNAVDIKAIKERKMFLEKELKYLNGLIELYSDEEEVDNEKEKQVKQFEPKPKMKRRKPPIKKFTDIVYNIIKENGEVSISDILTIVKETYPQAENYKPDALSAKVRTAVWTYKNQGKINARESDNNKYLYSAK